MNISRSKIISFYLKNIETFSRLIMLKIFKFLEGKF